MVVLSLLPVGFAQDVGERRIRDVVRTLGRFPPDSATRTFRWLRAIGDTIFAAGMLAMGWFVVGLTTGWSTHGKREDAAS